MDISGHEIEISHADKVFYPQESLSKGDVVEYYRKVADVMVGHMKRYGLSMQRFPDGLGGPSFYNKDAPGHFPDWIGRVHVPKRQGGSYDAPVVDSPAVLVYLANQAVLTHHLYLSPADDLEHPDRMIYDLDPPEDGSDSSAARQAALDLRSILEEIDLAAWIQTTGSKGYHLIVPLDGSEGFDEVREFATDVARLLVRRKPESYTLQQRKNKRKGKVFLDMLRNAYGATAVAAYSLRALPGAPVATPITWEELEDGAGPQDWNLRSIPRRLGQKDDPLADMHGRARKLSARRDKLASLLEAEDPAEEEDNS